MEQDHQTVNSADLGSDRPTQEQDSAPSNPNVADSHTAAGGQSDGCPSDGCPSDGRDFQQLMAASPTLSPLAGWLKCLRKPAISVEYSFKKRHVPDLDQDCAQIGQSGRSSSGGSFNADGSGQTVSASQSPSSCGKSKPSCGQNSDVMGMGGSFTIRYFDFALGILGLAIVKCVTRGCRCIGRKLD